MLYAGGYNYRFSMKDFSVFGGNRKVLLCRFFYRNYFCKLEFCAERVDLLVHFIGEFESGDDFMRGKIFYARGGGYLPAERLLLEYDNAFSVS